jgi:hypothetical protein
MRRLEDDDWETHKMITIVRLSVEDLHLQVVDDRKVFA